MTYDCLGLYRSYGAHLEMGGTVPRIGGGLGGKIILEFWLYSFCYTILNFPLFSKSEFSRKSVFQKRNSAEFSREKAWEIQNSVNKKWTISISNLGGKVGRRVVTPGKTVDRLRLEVSMVTVWMESTNPSGWMPP